MFRAIFQWLFDPKDPAYKIYSADFTNLVPLTEPNQQYFQTTLPSSGKKLLFISWSATTYQGAKDTCSSQGWTNTNTYRTSAGENSCILIPDSSHGADVLLPVDQAENDDVASFLGVQYEARNFGLYNPVAWLRLVKTESGWVDDKTDEPLTNLYDGPNGRFGTFNDWPYAWHFHGYIGEFKLVARYE